MLPCDSDEYGLASRDVPKKKFSYQSPDGRQKLSKRILGMLYKFLILACCISRPYDMVYLTNPAPTGGLRAVRRFSTRPRRSVEFV
jgi:hypothetical protein